MQLMMKKIMMVLGACMFMVFVSLSPAFAAYYLNQITNNQYDDVTPQISKNGDMVWVGFGELSADIFIYDGKTKVISQLMNDGVEDNNPQINDVGDIVWRKLNLDESDYNIMLYKKATGQITRISLPYNPSYSHGDNNPQINNLGQVVYESAPDGLDPEIMLYTGTTVTQITNNNLYDTNPMLNDNSDIVWTASTDGVNSDIWLYTNGTITRISTTAMEPSLGPRMNNLGDIVWSGWDTATSYYQIYYYKRSTGTTTKLTSSAFDNTGPLINLSGQITWTQGATNDGDIFFRSGLTGTNINITNTSGKDDSDPAINDNGWVTYSEDQGTTHVNDQIFVWSAGTTTRLITNTYDHISPQINNSNSVVWQGTGGAGTTFTDWEIFTATTHIPPVNCNDNNACTLDWGDPSDGLCKHDPISCAPMPCMDATCNTVTGCVYLPKNCNDNNACTIDNCDTITGACTHTPDPCNDFNACTIDTCVAPVTGCVHTLIAGIDDGNACTDDKCDPVTAVITHPVKNCNDNNICTTDSCNSATGCVNAPKCDDNNLCTIDVCNTATGACTNTPVNCDDRKSCTDDSCNTATGTCVNTLNSTRCPIKYNNNFTMLDPGNGLAGGTNDVVWAWDGTLKTSVSTSSQISNAILYSTCQYNGVSWTSHDVAVYGPGTYKVYAGCPAGSPGCGLGTVMTFIVKAGEIGAHMLFNWNDNNDIDVVNIFKPNAVFGPSRMWTGGCGSNSSCTIWGWMSYDWDGDGNNGGRMVDGPFVGFSPNFNFIGGAVNLCCDAATRCNDNNVCTTDTCNTATGACVNTPIVCNDNNVCTTDTCDMATGCVFTTKTCDDNNKCTTDSCNTVTGACSNVTINCADNNACTTDFCNTATGICAHTPIFCADGNACTTDTCNTATGCVFTPKNCSDNNLCTTDSCDTATGACINTPCASDRVCNSSVGCIPKTPVTTTGNNLTLIASNGIVLGGTNDVNFTWDATVQDVTTFAYGSGPSNATLSSDEPFSSWLWYARRVQVVGPGTYWVDLDGIGPSTNRYEVTIPNGQLGVHLLLDWGQTGQATSCGKTDCDVDVWLAWNFSKPFAAGKLFTGAEDGTTTNAPAWDEPYPMPFVMDGRANASAKVWDMVSVDLAGRITTSAGVTVTNLPLNAIPGIPMKEGTYNGASVNMSVMLTDLCFDAATRCNDNNACTKDTCNPTTGACSNTTIICNDDNNACTIDTCNTATGCVFTPKNCNDNNACTLDFCSPLSGICYHSTTAIVCNDNNVCTTDTCNTTTGCVYTNNTAACTDNNACTSNDHCSAGVCVAGTTVTCPVGVCNTASGCTYTNVSTTGNNLTMLLGNGLVMGGTNDVKFTWDGTVQNVTTFANGTGPSNATITSDEPFNGWLWYAKRVQVVGPGTYWVDLDGTGPSTNRYEVTIPANRIGAHLLLDWGDTGQATSCGKLNCDVDVWIAWDFNNAFMTGKLFTGADDGTTSNGPASDEPYPLPFVIDGKLNASTTVWNLVSVDLPGRVITATGGTLKDMPLNAIPGVPIKEGSYDGASASFNVKLQ